MITYKDAGVDVERGYEAVRLMKEHAQSTFNKNVMTNLGSFGGCYSLSGLTGKKPVLVSGTDGVGTKLKIAFLLDKHDTVGIDCVAMSVNDIICSGAKPLFFLDYIACGHNDPAVIEAIVAGVSEGCVQSGCALIGGETAEMPGFYPEDEYDLAGFAVGIVDKAKILDNTQVQAGDAIIALPSTGVHSNGFSLVRKVFGDTKEALSRHYGELGMTLGEELLTPTRIYVQPILALLAAIQVRAISHITGGGFYENIPRSLPKGMMARIDASTLVTPPIFGLIQQVGDIPTRDMFNTYNMGVGMSVVVPGEQADKAVQVLRDSGLKAYVCGEVIPGEDGVQIC